MGRGRELDETGQILATSRLVTLTGPGGAGKTTLAVELARRHHERYRDGAILVELAALADGDLIVEEMAEALRLELPSRHAPIDSLVAQLRGRQLLVVLDNCEHLIVACARTVTELLQGCPELSVLATSREPLRIEGEVSWRTPSLALPDPDHLPPVEALSGVASLQLFVQRASAVSPGFALTDDNAAALADICYRLDGMPLALELAAACVPVLSPQQIAARLGDALSLLRRGHRAPITRQQTLTATLDWSHNLLADDERVLFRRLAVFAGSFTLEAAEGVCVDGGPVLGTLARLVDTSLVSTEARGEITRYRLLETVRQYGAERLRVAGEEPAIRSRHSAWYVEFAESRDPEVPTSIIEVVPASLDVEHDNLRAALTWALAHEPRAALRLAVALWRYWLARGLLAEGRRWLEAVLTAVSELVRRARARAAGPRGFRPAPGHGRAARRDRCGNSRNSPRDQRSRAPGACVTCGRRTRLYARRLDSVLAAYRGGAGGRARCRRSRGVQRIPAGDGAARPPRSARRARGVRAGAGGAGRGALGAPILRDDDPRLGRRGRTHLLRGDRAARPARECRAGGGYVLCNLAYLARLAGDRDEAQGLLDEAVSIFRALGDRDGESMARSHLGCLHRVRAEFAEGRAALEHSLRIRHEIGDRREIGLTLGNLGMLTAAEGDLAHGLALLRQALAGFRETDDVPGRVATTLTIASLHAAAGDYEAARRMLPDALAESLQIPGNHRGTAWGFVMLSDVHRNLGDPDEAVPAMAEARILFQALGSGMVAAKRG